MNSQASAYWAAATLCVTVLLSGCVASQGVTVSTNKGDRPTANPSPSQSPSGSAGSSNSLSDKLRGVLGMAAPAPSPVPAPSPNEKTSKPPIIPKGIQPGKIDIVGSIRTQPLCQSPAENYDIGATLVARFGKEADLRLQRLLTTDFKQSTISKSDREMLNYMAREMLWIPVAVEEQIGNALLMASSRELEVLGKDGINGAMWTQSVDMIKTLAAAAPANPFNLNVILLQKGAPASLAGGVIFIDNETLKSTFDSDSKEAEEKLRFILAHEMAHIQRRHRAKRIQQILVDSDSGLKFMRQMIEKTRMAGGSSSASNFAEWLKTAAAVPRLVESLMQHHEKYGQDQELEADACATALMVDAKAGDPLRAFRAYRKDAAANDKGRSKAGAESIDTDLYASHPPDTLREARIAEKMKLLAMESGKAGNVSRPVAQDTRASRRPSTAKRPIPE